MKAQDLRIGNWVTSFDGGFIQVNGYLISMLHDHPNHNMKPYPIELDSEIFIKAGFEYCRVGSTVLKLNISNEDEEYPCSLQVSGSGIQVCRCGIGAICSPVFYLHELQNLYYALTQNELIITP